LRHSFPYAAAGQVIGLLGGSFDPAHSGHAHITREALKRFGLDQVWWLVSPGNPLKERGPAGMDRRLARAAQVMHQDWRQIMASVPVGVLARPGERISARMSRAASLYAGDRIAGRHARLLREAQAPAWCFVNVPMMDVSSSAIRASGRWG